MKRKFDDLVAAEDLPQDVAKSFWLTPSLVYLTEEVVGFDGLDKMVVVGLLRLEDLAMDGEFGGPPDALNMPEVTLCLGQRVIIPWLRWTSHDCLSLRWCERI